ncbi:MAG: hypothetical protein WCO40_06500 [Thermoleophilia bacterium]
MRSRRGQSTVEYVALVGCVAALLAIGATTLPASGIVAAAQSVFDRSEPPMASPAALAFVDAALTGSGPTINDAIERLGQEIGPTEARALVLSHTLRAATPPAATGRLRPLTDPAWALARSEFNGVGPSVTSEAWSNEAPRATRTLWLVSADDERRWLASQSTSGAAKAIELGTSGVVSLLSSINPATAATTIVIGAGAAAVDSASRGTPAGSRDGDVIICRFVWRTNEATSMWTDHHPLESSRLRLGVRIAAVDISVVRAGHLIEHDVVWSHATTC